MKNLLARALRAPVLRVVLLATLVSGSLAALGIGLLRSGAAQSSFGELAPWLGVTHPLGRLRGLAPLPHNGTAAPSAGSGKLDEVHVLLNERGAARDRAGCLGACVD